MNFSKSNSFLDICLQVIPLASQTFSKSHLQYPAKMSPLFIERGEGAKVWDIDGNCFLDMVSGLMSNVLGYNDPDVNAAIQAQLQKGISFSLPTQLEHQLAYKLKNIIPCAEMVRFGKTGTDVNSAAIRLARAYTKREKVLVCGYHGWQDWYIGSTTRNLGVPKEIASLTTKVNYNNLEQLENELKTNQYAAFIMEPTNITAPLPGYLESVRALTQKYNTVLIFDEIVTGFHMSLGGAQEYFGVIPDLASFGKGMGNGMPISAILGRKDIMLLMDDIFFSGTFGGEALSLAAAIAVIEKMQTEPVIDHLWQVGSQISEQVQSLIDGYNLQDVIKLNGYSPWRILSFADYKNFSANTIKTFFQKEMIANGVLILASHNICYAMKDAEVNQLVQAYKHTLDKLQDNLHSGELVDALGCPTIEPIFKVR